MYRNVILFALLLTAAAVAALATEAEAQPAAPTPSQIDTWARQLGDEKHAAREEATRALVAAGPAAIEAVRKASRSDDPETASRAKMVLVELVDKPAIAKRQNIVRLRDGGPKEESQSVIRGAEAWKAWIATCISEDTRRQISSLKIDFDKEMLLVASEGPANSLLARFEAEESGIQGIQAKADAWKVEVVVVKSDKHTDTDLHPVYITRVPRTEKRVEFRVLRRDYGG